MQKRGATVGALVGVGAALAVGAALCWDDYNGFGTVLFCGAVISPMTVLPGALIGTLAAPETWRSVRQPELRVGIGPARGGVGARLTYSF